MTTPNISFLSIEPGSWAKIATDMGMPAFRGRQIFEWIYKQFQNDPLAMNNLPIQIRQKLSDTFDWSLPQVIERLDASDGSSKLLLESAKGHRIETVVMRYEKRVTVCVSSQVGCKLSCRFCQTGKLGFVRHLGREEILGQFYLSQKILRSEEQRRLSHVVFMGMGEPFDNYDESVAAANRLIDPEAFALSARHVTLSTSGLVPRIHSLAADSRASLALSLHASRDDLRTELMPINKRYPLAELKAALLDYQKQTDRKITIEYILIRGKNCGLREAKELVQFLQGLRAKVNLIPFNAHPGLEYAEPQSDEVRAFQKYLADRSIPAPVRYSKGRAVSGGCGQLAAKTEMQLASHPARKALSSGTTARPSEIL